MVRDAREDNPLFHDREPETSYPDLDDHELLKRVQDGDTEAFQQIYYRYRDQLLTFCWKMTGDHELAADVLKETFLGFIEESGDLDRTVSIETHLYEMARNQLQDRGGEETGAALKQLSGDTLAGEGDWTGPAEKQHILSDSLESLMDLLQAMRYPDRELVVLCCFEGLSLPVVARLVRRDSKKVREQCEKGLGHLILALRAAFPGRFPEKTGVSNEGGTLCSEYDLNQFLEEAIREEKTSDPERTGLNQNHVQNCEACSCVRREMDALLEFAGEADNFTLPPFPKGDESDLFSEARERINEKSPEGGPDREWDPDLLDVLKLIPLALLLAILVFLLPLLV